MRPQRITVTLAAYTLLAVSAAATNAQTYTTIDYPASFATEFWGIDDDSIVGSRPSSPGAFSSFLYDGADFTDLNYPGALSTDVYDVDDSRIVGTYQDASFRNRGFVYDRVDWTTIDYPGDSSIQTHAAGIDGNNIVGWWFDQLAGPGGGVSSFLYDGANFARLDYPGSNRTSAYGISGDKIVGTYFDAAANRNRGFLYGGTTWTALDAGLTGRRERQWCRRYSRFRHMAQKPRRRFAGRPARRLQRQRRRRSDRSRLPEAKLWCGIWRCTAGRREWEWRRRLGRLCCVAHNNLTALVGSASGSALIEPIAMSMATVDLHPIIEPVASSSFAMTAAALAEGRFVQSQRFQNGQLASVFDAHTDSQLRREPDLEIRRRAADRALERWTRDEATELLPLLARATPGELEIVHDLAVDRIEMGAAHDSGEADSEWDDPFGKFDGPSLSPRLRR